MHLPLTLIHALVLAFASLSTSAHESTDSSRRKHLPGIDALPAAPLVARTFGTDDVLARVRFLLENTRVRRMMTPPLTAKGTPIVSIQEAAPYVRAFAAIEGALAERFALPIERVRDEVDFLMNVSGRRLRSADRIGDLRAMLEGRRFAPLGPEFDQELYAAMIAVNSVMPKAYLTYLAKRWRRSARAARQLLAAAADRGTVQQYVRLNDWLAAPLPPELAREARPGVSDEATRSREAALDLMRRFYADLPAGTPGAVETTICDLVLKNGKLPF